MMVGEFNFQPYLKGKRLFLRPIQKNDFDGLFACASDKKLWDGHPAKDRYKEAEFKKWFQRALKSRSALIVINVSINKIIGSSRFYVVDSEPSDISIGYTFIHRSYWGGATNSLLKKIMLDYAFKYYETVWFHIAPSNIRSQRAIEKIGAVFSHEKDSLLSGKCEPWLFYKIKKSNHKP